MPDQCPVCEGRGIERFCTLGDHYGPGDKWEIWHCSACEYGWTLPGITPEELADYYPPAYLGDTRKFLDEFDAGTVQRHRSWRRQTEKIELVERFKSSGSILDIGASDGSFLLALDSVRWQRHGIEMIEPVVELVKVRHPELGLEAGDIYSENLAAHSFDVITFWHVFEHLYEPHRVLSRVAELLKPGGIVVISVPNFASYQSRFFGNHWYAFDVPRHLHHYSPQSLDHLLGGVGFEVLENVFFSLMNNFHQLKYSLISWSESSTSSRLPYYLLKPGLSIFQWWEGLGSRFGSLTTIARLG